jgi:hypothetical protein
MTDFQFGDIEFGLIVDKDTDISKEVIEKNFVDGRVSAYELTPNLESGTYSIIFNKENHSQSEPMSQQRDAALSMSERHTAEFPFVLGSDEGHVLVEQSNVSYTPSQMIDEGEMSIRFLDSGTYRPAYKLQAETVGDFSVGTVESVLPIASSAGDVFDESDGSTLSPIATTIDTEGGNVDLFTYDSSQSTYSYNRSSNDYGESERVAPARTLNANDERIYSSLHQVTSGSVIDNGRVEAQINDSSVGIAEYDGSSWSKFGQVDTFSYDPAYLSNISNIRSTVSFRNDVDMTITKALPFIRFDFSGKTKFDFNLEEGFSVNSSSGKAITVTDNSNRSIALMRGTNEGSLGDDGDSIFWDSLDSSTEYTAFIIVNASTFEDYVYCLGNRKRTLVQK